MSTNSKIEWTDKTWNPVTGCTKVSQGCKNCYAERMYERFNGKGTFKNITCHEDRLLMPIKWKHPANVFVNSMSDLFHESVPFHFIDQVFAVMILSPHLRFQVLTKRAERMLEYMRSREDYWQIDMAAEMLVGMNPHLFHVTEKLKGDARKLHGSIGITNELLPHLKQAGWVYDFTYTEFGTDVDLVFEGDWPAKNIWLGVSVEDQKAADERIPLLMQTPAAVRFLSCEPLLGPVDLNNFLFRPVHNGAPADLEPNGLIHWVIVGGESGPGARPMHPDWVRLIKHQCQICDIPFFFKQWGEWAPHMADANHKQIPIVHNGIGYQMCRAGKKKAGRVLDDNTYSNFPNA